jgi:hypothetical protein
VRDPLEAARAASAFLAAESRLRVHPPKLEPDRDAVAVPFESIAGRLHRILFSLEFLGSRDDEEIAGTLRECWVPEHMRHENYETLLVTSEGVSTWEG